MVVPLEHVIILSGILFAIGVLGVLFRRNALVIFMSIEIMLNAVNLALVGFSRSIAIRRVSDISRRIYASYPGVYERQHLVCLPPSSSAGA